MFHLHSLWSSTTTLVHRATQCRLKSQTCRHQCRYFWSFRGKQDDYNLKYVFHKGSDKRNKVMMPVRFEILNSLSLLSAYCFLYPQMCLIYRLRLQWLKMIWLWEVDNYCLSASTSSLEKLPATANKKETAGNSCTVCLTGLFLYVDKPMMLSLVLN